MLEIFRAHQPVHCGPAGQSQYQHNGDKAATENGCHCEYQQNVGNGSEDVVEPFECVIDGSAKIAG